MRNCPECGAPLPHQEKRQQQQADNEPRLSRGMMIFILTGLVLLVGFGGYYYAMRHNDPDYVRTLIEPDSTLADRDDLHFDVAPVDTAAAAEAEKEEKREAEKMFNSIRRQPKEEETTEAAPEPSESSEAASEPKAEAPAVEAAPAPKIEAIETE